MRVPCSEVLLYVISILCLFHYHFFIMFILQYVILSDYVYSRTSDQRTRWERVFCPLFGGCPYLGGSLYFDIIINSTMFKLLWMNFILSVGGEIVM